MLGDIHNNSSAGDVPDALVQDELIDSMLNQVGFRECVAMLADYLAVRFSQVPDSYSEPDGISVSWSERVAAWRTLAKKMRMGEVLC
jgi:hypothetical protein